MKLPELQVLIETKEPQGEPYLSEYATKDSIPFSSISQVSEYRQEDIQQVRKWKNNVIKIRDSYKGTNLFVTWDLEARRVVGFLNKFNE